MLIEYIESGMPDWCHAKFRSYQQIKVVTIAIESNPVNVNYSSHLQIL